MELKIGAWLESLDETIRELEARWSLTLGTPFKDASCAWVAPVTLANGTSAVLKIGMPHFEAEHEVDGLRFWDGDPTVRLLDADDRTGAMLLERCIPGSSLRELPEPEQDSILAGLLRRLWRRPAEPHRFRPLSALMAYWSEETLADAEHWAEPALVREGLSLFEELPRTARTEVLLATDLHAGNVLRSAREPWLVIDPKPFIGDPAYDATQHLFNCVERLLADPRGTIHRMADLLGLEYERIRLWTFARAATEPREDCTSTDLLVLAKAVSQA
jgi:streptomycin 6-kinase